jgi:hypothetical protein
MLSAVVASFSSAAAAPSKGAAKKEKGLREGMQG